MMYRMHAIPPYYWKAIRATVCIKCMHGGNTGVCRLDPPLECPLQLYFPFLVDVVSGIPRDTISEYVREVRLLTCSQCKHQTVNGNCVLTAEMHCALDEYFPLVLETIGVSRDIVTQYNGDSRE